MAPVRGRPLGPLGWLLTVLLEAAVGEDEEAPESGRGDDVFVNQGRKAPVMERKAA